MTLNKEELRELLEEILDTRTKVYNEEHYEQHEWIRARIESEKLRRDFYREAIKTTIQYSLPVILGSAIYWLQGHLKL
jgi:hypothetical protein